jgi:hypothetical protein
MTCENTVNIGRENFTIVFQLQDCDGGAIDFTGKSFEIYYRFGIEPAVIVPGNIVVSDPTVSWTQEVGTSIFDKPGKYSFFVMMNPGEVEFQSTSVYAQMGGSY